MTATKPIPLSEVRGAWWWDLFYVKREKFNKQWAERVPDGHFLPAPVAVIPARERELHRKVFERAKRQTPDLTPEPTVSGIVNDGGKIFALIGHSVLVDAECAAFPGVR